MFFFEDIRTEEHVLFEDMRTEEHVLFEDMRTEEHVFFLRHETFVSLEQIFEKLQSNNRKASGE